MAGNAVLVYDRTRSKRALGFRRGSYRFGGLSKPANYTKCHDKCCRKHSTHPVPPLRATLLDFTPPHLKVNRCNAPTARFRTLYVFLLMEVGTRRIVHSNVTADATAAWTLQQLREAIPSDHSYRLLVHDRDSIFSAEVDQQVKAFGLRVLHTPARAPKANAYCERLVGSVRRECLDFMIPMGEKHMRRILSEWVTHYNQGRPHLSLGPWTPQRAAGAAPARNADQSQACGADHAGR